MAITGDADRRRRRQRAASPSPSRPTNCARAAVRAQAHGLRRRAGEQSRRHDLHREGRIAGARPGEHPQSRPDDPGGAALAADDDPESVPGSGLQRQSRLLRRRLGDRRRDRAHARVQEPAAGVRPTSSPTAAPRSPTSSSCCRAKASRSSLDGKTYIKNGITYSKFETSPDAPFTKFETIFPAGPHSALTPNVPENEDYNLCKNEPHAADRNHRPERRVHQPDHAGRRHGLQRRRRLQSHEGAAARQSAEGLQEGQARRASASHAKRRARKKYGSTAKKSAENAKKSAKK